MDKTLFVIDCKVGETVEHKTVTDGIELIKSFNNGFIVGEKEGNVGVYYFPSNLAQIQDNKVMMLILSKKLDTKIEPLKNAPLLAILQGSIAIQVQSSAMLNVLNNYKFSEYTKRRHSELDNQEIAPPFEDNKKETILLSEHEKIVEQLKSKYINELDELTKSKKDELTRQRLGEVQRVQDLVLKNEKVKTELEEKTKALEKSESENKDLKAQIATMESDKEMASKKHSTEIENMQKLMSKKDSEIEELKQKLSVYQSKEKEHIERVQRARDNFKKNWVGKGRQHKIHGHKEEEIILSLRNKGLTIKEIAESVGRSTTTISKILAMNGMTKKRGGAEQ